MNYITHLSAVMEKIRSDNRLNASHVSLYLALFQFWNVNRFNNPISIHREDTMQLSKIGSKNTYHKCISELSEWGFVKYLPSHNPLKGSLIHMYDFSTTIKQPMRQEAGQVQVPSLNDNYSFLYENKTVEKEKRVNFKPPKLEDCIELFIQQNFTKTEAESFICYYESNAWFVGKSKMKNWQAAARNWMLRSTKFQAQKKPALTPNNLHLKPTNYEESL